MTNERVAILACAGLGSRMGMSHNQSKELLIDPATNEPLIEWHLKYCEKNGLLPLVVTRKEKQDLLEYCTQRNVKTIVIEPEGEWPMTIYKSREHWGRFNVVLFPDAKFSDNKFIERSKSILDTQMSTTMVYGVHEVEDASKWCIINYPWVQEKPKHYKKTKALAIVMFAFKNTTGAQLFRHLNDDKFAGAMQHNILFVDKYVDLTRTGTIEHVDL